MSLGAGIVPNVRRLAVLKAGGLGDLIFALPALDALRTAYPRAWIVLLTSPTGVELMRGRPGPVDEALAVPPFEGPAAATPEAREALDRFCEQVSRPGLDLALQVHGGGANSNPLVRRLGARVSVGLRAPGAPALDREVPYVYFQSEVLRCLEVASLVGAAAVGLEPRIAAAEADRAAAEALLPPDGRPLAVIHPGAGDSRRWWPAQRFAEVALRLAREGARMAVVGTQGDAALASIVAGSVPGSADLCGRTNVAALAGVLAEASVVVSNDSGPLHLAAALGAPTVGVYWCGNLVNAGPTTVSRHRALAAWRLTCPVCGADCMSSGCDHDATFVADVPVEDVVLAALDLLATESRDPAREGVATAELHP